MNRAPAKRAVVVGPGAIGTYMAVHLVEAGYDVDLVGRPGSSRFARLKQDGLTLETPEGTKHVSAERLRFFDRVEDVPRESGAHVFIDSVKQTHNVGSSQKLGRDLLAPEGIMIPAVNGVPPWWPDGKGMDHVVGCSMIISGTRTDAGAVMTSSAASTRIELGIPGKPLTPGRRTTYDAFRNAMQNVGVQAVDTPSIAISIANKLIINGSTNVTAAVTRGDMGALVQDPYFKRLVTRMGDEVRNLMATDVPQDSLMSREALLGICERFSSHPTSTGFDVRHGREPEWPLFDGLLHLAEAKGQPMPFYRDMMTALRVTADHAKQHGGLPEDHALPPQKMHSLLMGMGRFQGEGGLLEAMVKRALDVPMPDRAAKAAAVDARHAAREGGDATLEEQLLTALRGKAARS